MPYSLSLFSAEKFMKHIEEITHNGLSTGVCIQMSLCSFHRSEYKQSIFNLIDATYPNMKFPMAMLEIDKINF